MPQLCNDHIDHINVIKVDSLRNDFKSQSSYPSTSGANFSLSQWESMTGNDAQSYSVCSLVLVLEGQCFEGLVAFKPQPTLVYNTGGSAAIYYN